MKECFDKTEVGIHALSGLMKIDLSSAIDSVLNTVFSYTIEFILLDIRILSCSYYWEHY